MSDHDFLRFLDPLCRSREGIAKHLGRESMTYGTSPSPPAEPLTLEEIAAQVKLLSDTYPEQHGIDYLELHLAPKESILQSAPDLDREYSRDRGLRWVWCGGFQQHRPPVVSRVFTPTWKHVRKFRRTRRREMLKDVRRRKRQWPLYPLKKALVASVSAGEIGVYYGCRFIEE